MNRLEALGIFLIEVDARDAAVVNLPPELAEVGATLVPYPCFGEETTAATGLEYADREVDIFAETHLAEASEPRVDVAPDAHIERARVEFVELFLAAANAACGEKARHRIRNGFLYVGKGSVGAIGSAKSIGRLASQLVVDGLEIVHRQHDVAVKYDEILALCALGTIVAALAGATIGFVKILQVEPIGVLVADRPAGNRRTIFDNDDLEVLQRLASEALEQLIHLVGTIKNRDDNRVFHGQPLISVQILKTP